MDDGRWTTAMDDGLWTIVDGLWTMDDSDGRWTMNSDELKKRTKEFAHAMVRLSVGLPKRPVSDHIGRQIVRCATSVAANYRAASLSQTKAGFVAKISIVVEEADECEFWLEFIEDEELLSAQELVAIRKEAHELTSIFIAMRKTARSEGR